MSRTFWVLAVAGSFSCFALGALGQRYGTRAQRLLDGKVAVVASGTCGHSVGVVASLEATPEGSAHQLVPLPIDDSGDPFGRRVCAVALRRYAGSWRRAGSTDQEICDTLRQVGLALDARSGILPSWWKDGERLERTDLPEVLSDDTLKRIQPRTTHRAPATEATSEVWRAVDIGF